MKLPEFFHIHSTSFPIAMMKHKRKMGKVAVVTAKFRNFALY